MILADAQQCNHIFGIDNLTKLDHLSMQARGNISRETYEQLPDTLKRRGTMMLMEGDLQSFSAIYKLSPKTSSSSTPADDYFLFWGIALGDETMRALQALTTDDEKLDQAEKELIRRGCSPDGLPMLPRVGRQNLKIGLLGSSVPLQGAHWRKTESALGRVVFIGDAIHAMSRMPLLSPFYCWK